MMTLKRKEIQHFARKEIQHFANICGFELNDAQLELGVKMLNHEDELSIVQLERDAALEDVKKLGDAQYHLSLSQNALRELWELLGVDNQKAAFDEVKILEALQPDRTQGCTSDSVVVQCAQSDLRELWELLGVDSQTKAVVKLSRWKKELIG